MPSSVTHTFFAMDVYQKLPNHCKTKINSKLEYFKLFAQGSDPFMFYHFLIGKKAKMGSNLQGKMHSKDTRKFFMETIRLMDSNQLVSNEEAMSYLYGYICHYYLDLFAHPFIYYKSGKFKKEEKSTYRYNGLHQEIEYRIDSYLIQKRLNCDVRKFRVDQFIFQVDNFSDPVKRLMEETIGKIYDQKDVGLFYERSVWYMKKFFRYMNYDPYGVKLKIYRLIDRVSPKRMIRLEELSYYTPYLEDSNYLNLEHKKWCYPWDNTKWFTTSFLDLYDAALSQAVMTIQEVTIMLEHQKINEKKLKELFQDLSFVTGLSCDKIVKMKYFEF